jgi:hypothetical protein
MQTTADFVGTVIELAASVEFCHDDFSSRNTKFLVLIHWNSSPIISYRERMVGMKNNLHRVVESCEMFVNRVVDHFPNAVVESRAVMRVAEVHARSFSNGLETLENLDASSVIIIAHNITLIWIENGVPRLGCESKTYRLPPLNSTARYGV